ncbi:MAG TPA: pantoate--beta-alanine ligase [Acidimicrobiales bacterium]|nr:pantoate--beta-alanine ligase [Acidimicrobiales bacterium]
MTEVAALSAALDAHRLGGGTVGLVPTMGALHDGHASLIRRATGECDLAAVTIFVNPLQFGAGEDFEAYPRTLDADLAVAGAAGASVVFAPTVAAMYPVPMMTTVSVGGMTDVLEGASRPGHFDGVATVVAKLFAMAGRCRAYFGEKDFQQLAVVRRMASDLSLPVEVVGCPTVREPDGLALSSRNSYLTPEERRAAPLLHRALRAGAEAVAAGEGAPAARRAIVATVAAEPLFSLDYAEVVDPSTFTTPDPLSGPVRLLIAARLGRTRLIDNLAAVAPAPAAEPYDPPKGRKAAIRCAGA